MNSVNQVLKLKWLLSLILATSVCFPAFAEPKIIRNANVINFEDELIQGEVRKPDLFIQMGGSKATMESVLFSRQDFNDFHRLDKTWRPAYFGQKKRSVKK